MNFEKTVNADIFKSLNEAAEENPTSKNGGRVVFDYTVARRGEARKKCEENEFLAKNLYWREDGKNNQANFSTDKNEIISALKEIGYSEEENDFIILECEEIEESTLDSKERVCRRCHHKVFPSDVEGYPYVCKHCDENLYDFETEEIDDDDIIDPSRQFSGLIKVLNDVEKSFGVVLDIEIDGDDDDNEFWFDTNYNRKTFETETEANEFEDKYQEAFSKWCADNGYRCNRSEDEDAPLSFWITKITNESKECDCGSKDCPICGKKIEESEESRQYQGYTYTIEKCDGGDAYCLTVTNDDGEKVNWDEEKFGTAEGQTFDELAERAHNIIDADIQGPENINESADSNKVLYFGFSVKEPVEGLEDKIESGFYQFDFDGKHYIVAEALADGEFRITSEAFIMSEILDAIDNQTDLIGLEGIHAFIGTDKGLEKEISGKAIPVASYDEDGNVIECLNVDVFDLIGMTDTVASEIFAGSEEKGIAGYRIADEKEITECECGSKDCPICGKKKINEGKECKKVCFITSDPTLIDALNSGVVGLTLTVKTVEEDGKEGTAEIAIKPDAIKELAINDCEEEKPIEECDCGSKDCPICGKKTEENEQ